MYIAILIMAAGIAVGRALSGHIREDVLGCLIFCAILFLLFLLGLQIGANDDLFADLPRLGVQGALIMLACVAGSVLVVSVIAKLLARRGLDLSGSAGKDAR